MDSDKTCEDSATKNTPNTTSQLIWLICPNLPKHLRYNAANSPYRESVVHDPITILVTPVNIILKSPPSNLFKDLSKNFELLLCFYFT